ncbi:hypothetical protein EVAR_6_1 [Eumeta japonica]|uniref:Uncharacterized protein n=1 Tax=Eumeta variegata TaxID=151549 RepID=A0A4C1S7F3_EUMVA|nr:hypothetical protein EVAR_6_1 [Eumeta japonica]
MSQPGAGKKAPGKGPPKKNPPEEDKAEKTGKSTEDKDDTASNNGDKKEPAGNGDVVKPPSAGVNMRDAAAKILALAQKGEWAAVEQTLKVLEKIVAAGGEDTNNVPMAGIMDPVHVRLQGVQISILDYLKLLHIP